jgi:hypothetical protein
MPSVKYYREQAQLLLGWALATNDADQATQLTTRAIELLTRSIQAEGVPTGLNQAAAEFNALDPDFTRPAQQQQQVQPKADE